MSVDFVSKIFRKVVSVPAPVSGMITHIKGTQYEVNVQYRALDCPAAEWLQLAKCTQFKVNNTIEVLSSPSMQRVECFPTVPSSYYKAVIRSDKKDKENQLLEIWSPYEHIDTIKISEVDVHGSICLDDHFKALSWSRTSGKLLYVAQKKKQKNISYFDKTKENNKEIIYGHEYIRKETWGECLNEIEHTVAGILDVKNNCEIKIIDEHGLSLASPKWLDNENKVVSCGYKEANRVGLIYCDSRPAEILIHDLKDDSPKLIDKLSSPNQAYHSPRVSNSGHFFIFLANDVFGAHKHSKMIMMYDIRTKTLQTIMDKRYFINSLTENCFTPDDKQIIFQASTQFDEKLYCLDIETKKVKEIVLPTSNVNLLDFKDGVILAVGHQLDMPKSVYIALLNDEVTSWHCLDGMVYSDHIKVHSESISCPSDPDYKIGAILCSPKTTSSGEMITNSNNLPTVVVLHGGPHTALNRGYMQAVDFYVRMGLNVLYINYRGSTGIDDAHSESLVGKIGQYDIEDCLTCLRYLINSNRINRYNLILCGGSHGGFLACHLSCIDEFKFLAAVIRNPCVDLLSLWKTSDIPDWVLAEALGHRNYDPTWLPSEEDLKKLYSLSPSSRCHNASVPTLMQLGKNDLRVPISQGERWVQMLQARGIETKCQVYDDVHQLASKAEVFCQTQISAGLWMLSHLDNVKK